jgi:hypothetical protein
MTPAILSFATPGRVMFRCDALDIHDRRDLEAAPPFAAWCRAYATGAWSAEGLLGIGLAIGRWFNGRQHWLTRLREATAPVVLSIETRTHPEGMEKIALDVPWELIADEPGRVPAAPVPTSAGVAAADPLTELLAQLGPVDLSLVRHLALEPGLMLTTVRRLGPAAAPRSPSQYRLSVVFMAAQPDGLKQLHADREEAAIRRASGGIGMDLAVEDSGTLDGLAEMVARVGDCDVIQVSCHGAGGANPLLALEGRRGQRVDATAADLSNAFGHKPRLIFLSACSTAAAALDLPTAGRPMNTLAAALGSDVLWPLSTDLCRRGWPAVLGWSSVVSDLVAIEFSRMLYRQLALRVPLTEALARARVELASSPGGAAWHKPRLYLGPSGGGQVVNSVRPRPDQPDIIRAPEFIDPATRKIPMIAADQPFPHRRAFQRVMITMRDGDCSGVVVHGGNELARATFAGRVLRRVDRELSRVVVAREFDALAIVQEIRVQTARREIDEIAASKGQAVSDDPADLLATLREIIEGPCRSAGNGAFVLVLHGFDPVVTSSTRPDERRDLPPELLPVARALVRAFAGSRTASRLLFTSAAPFSIIDSNGDDLAVSLRVESLEPR